MVGKAVSGLVMLDVSAVGHAGAYGHAVKEFEVVRE